MTATLLILSSTAGVLALPSPAGAADPTPKVTVYPDGFVSAWGRGVVYAKPRTLIKFELADPTDTQHTVTVRPEDCTPSRFTVCEQRFDVPDKSNGVEYAWSKEGEYDFYDRFHPELTGKMIVTTAPPTVQPPPVDPPASSTTTTTTAPTTTTTAPAAIHPLEVPPDPVTTTTTTAALGNPPPSPTTAPPADKGDKNKDKNKDKDKAKGPTATSTTEPPPAGEAMPPDSIFDPAMLTPGATLMPGASATDANDEAAIDAEAAASLLDPKKSGNDSTHLMLLAIGGIALLLLAGGCLAWFNRSAAYDPA